MSENGIDDRISKARTLMSSITVFLHRLQTARGKTCAICDQLSDAGICTGTVYWRKDGAAGRMYANHAIGMSCPTHGEPKTPRGRIRYYIGTNPEAQAATKQQIANAAMLVSHRYEIERLDRALWRVTGLLTEIETTLVRGLHE